MATEPPRIDALNALLDDVEEALSRRIGDVAAHRLIGTLRELAALQADAARRLGEGLIEYALEEQRLPVPRAKLDALAAAGARLHESLERLEKRVERLAGER